MSEHDYMTSPFWEKQRIWIEEKLQEGYSVEHIQKGLLKEGYSVEGFLHFQEKFNGWNKMNVLEWFFFVELYYNVNWEDGR